MSHQTRYEACYIMPCLLNDYKYPGGSIIFCSTSNSHMILKHCGGIRKEDVHSIHTVASLTVSTTRPLVLSHPPPKTCSLSKRLPEEKLWYREKNKETGNQKTKREKCYERVNYSPPFKGNHVAKTLRSHQDKGTWRQPEPVPVDNTVVTTLSRVFDCGSRERAA